MFLCSAEVVHTQEKKKLLSYKDAIITVQSVYILRSRKRIPSNLFQLLLSQSFNYSVFQAEANFTLFTQPTTYINMHINVYARYVYVYIHTNTHTLKLDRKTL